MTGAHDSYGRSSRPGSSRPGSAARPRVDCWWRTPPGRQSQQPATTKKENSFNGVTTSDMDGRSIPVTDYTYPYWVENQQKKTKKLTKKQMQSSIERLTTPWYMQNRPQSAPPMSMRATAPAGTMEGADAAGAGATGPARPASAMTMPASQSELAFSWGATQKTKVLSPSDEQEMIERLYKVKMLPEIPEKRCVKLSHQYDGNGFKEVWVPAKTYTKEESTEALVELKKRTDEKIQKLHAKLQDKYMKPLVVSKTVKLGDPEFKEKIELLYKGQGTVKRSG